MGAFLLKLDQDEDEEVDTLEALWLTILTADRTVETRFADMNEFEALGTKDSLWRIPPERMKKNREHLVPLSKQADELAQRRISRLRPGQTLLFARNTRSGVISENTMLYAMYRLGYRGRATVHGFRGTFSTLANSATKMIAGEEVRMWEPDWIEWALSHVEDNEVRAAYNSAEYLPERRRLLQWWADWLDQQLELARIIG
jgi:integrase